MELKYQYVACKFREEDTRSYTYQWDGEPLAVGDLVKVADNRSDGWKRVIVTAVDGDKPPFDCKPILGKVEAPDPEPEALDVLEPAQSYKGAF